MHTIQCLSFHTKWNIIRHTIQCINAYNSMPVPQWVKDSIFYTEIIQPIFSGVEISGLHIYFKFNWRKPTQNIISIKLKKCKHERIQTKIWIPSTSALCHLKLWPKHTNLSERYLIFLQSQIDNIVSLACKSILMINV